MALVHLAADDKPEVIFSPPGSARNVAIKAIGGRYSLIPVRVLGDFLYTDKSLCGQILILLSANVGVIAAMPL